MSARQFKTLAKRWKMRFALADWEIKFLFILEKDMTANDCGGLSVWQPEHKYAEVEVSSEQTDEKIEHALVHELLHIVLEGHVSFDWNDGKYEVDPQFEYGLNIISTALLAKRQREKRREISINGT